MCYTQPVKKGRLITVISFLTPVRCCCCCCCCCLQGGPLLQAQGLHNVITDEQYQQLAIAEVVQQAYGLHKVSTLALYQAINNAGF
jgi:hypothetical protein